MAGMFAKTAIFLNRFVIRYCTLSFGIIQDVIQLNLQHVANGLEI
jgi:hypothetical protein